MYSVVYVQYKSSVSLLAEVLSMRLLQGAASLLSQASNVTCLHMYIHNTHDGTYTWPHLRYVSVSPAGCGG